MSYDEANVTNEQVASSLEKCDWAGCSIGNKMLLRLAVKRLRETAIPAAPVEGLETVEALHGPETNICWTQNNTPKEHRKIVQLMPEGDYVTRSQAEAIIAAKDRLLAASDTVAQQLQNQIVTLTLKKEDLKADNAALTARVKELEGKLSDPRVKRILSEKDGTGYGEMRKIYRENLEVKS